MQPTSKEVRFPISDFGFRIRISASLRQACAPLWLFVFRFINVTFLHIKSFWPENILFAQFFDFYQEWLKTETIMINNSRRPIGLDLTCRDPRTEILLKEIISYET